MTFRIYIEKNVQKTCSNDEIPYHNPWLLNSNNVQTQKVIERPQRDPRYPSNRQVTEGSIQPPGPWIYIYIYIEREREIYIYLFIYIQARRGAAHNMKIIKEESMKIILAKGPPLYLNALLTAQDNLGRYLSIKSIYLGRRAVVGKNNPHLFKAQGRPPYGTLNVGIYR